MPPYANNLGTPVPMRLATLSLIATLTLLPAAFAQEDQVRADIERIHGDAQGFFELLSALQDAVAADDPAVVAEHAFYPLAVNAPDGNYEIVDEDELLESFDTVFTPAVEKALLDQDLRDLIVTQDGVGLGKGAMWITNVCLDESCVETRWGILSINEGA